MLFATAGLVSTLAERVGRRLPFNGVDQNLVRGEGTDT
jgi:hypothetical protein